MVKIIQTNSIITNGKEGDFQSRIIKYSSFKDLINDFENNDLDKPFISTMEGKLRPLESELETIFKDDFHASYKLYTGIYNNDDNCIIAKFYLVN